MKKEADNEKFIESNFLGKITYSFNKGFIFQRNYEEELDIPAFFPYKPLYFSKPESSGRSPILIHTEDNHLLHSLDCKKFIVYGKFPYSFKVDEKINKVVSIRSQLFLQSKKIIYIVSRGSLKYIPWSVMDISKTSNDKLVVLKKDKIEIFGKIDDRQIYEINLESEPRKIFVLGLKTFIIFTNSAAYKYDLTDPGEYKKILTLESHVKSIIEIGNPFDSNSKIAVLAGNIVLILNRHTLISDPHSNIKILIKSPVMVTNNKLLILYNIWCEFQFIDPQNVLRTSTRFYRLDGFRGFTCVGDKYFFFSKIIDTRLKEKSILKIYKFENGKMDETAYQLKSNIGKELMFFKKGWLRKFRYAYYARKNRLDLAPDCEQIELFEKGDVCEVLKEALISNKKAPIERKKKRKINIIRKGNTGF
ncbi:hypothetical protein TCON_0580 [Astathelohania contejeani]|uniref:Uncharacterized protein n=1 Tax=Astathelohania contejeani TaxID=164912 RepID=A0ABQ7I178_9MICR|nr:hypothetical protein TCON_0580 [Thelohania contejeani]